MKYSHTHGDIEYEIEIDGGDYFISDIQFDFGMDADDLYFMDKNMKQVSFTQFLADKAHEAFLDEFGSVSGCIAEGMADHKYEEER